MLQEIEKSVILKQEYDRFSGKYYILVKTDTSAIAFYGSYGNRQSMATKIMSEKDYYKKKSEKEREYKEDYNAKFEDYIPKNHINTFIKTIKDNSNASIVMNMKEQERIEKEKERRKLELEKEKEEKIKKDELLSKKNENMKKIQNFEISLF